MYCCSLMLMLSARPKRTLLFVLLFVVVAGVVGGPIAGSLQTEGGFAATESGSAKAEARIEAATGRQESPGVVALMRDQSQAADRQAPSCRTSPGSRASPSNRCSAATASRPTSSPR